MVDETTRAVVICPTCRHTTAQNLGWFRTVSAWDCSFCAATLEIDQDPLTKFLADKGATGAGFVARLSPRQIRGITTRRTR